MDELFDRAKLEAVGDILQTTGAALDAIDAANKELGAALKLINGVLDEVQRLNDLC